MLLPPPLAITTEVVVDDDDNDGLDHHGDHRRDGVLSARLSHEGADRDAADRHVYHSSRPPAWSACLRGRLCPPAAHPR